LQVFVFVLPVRLCLCILDLPLRTDVTRGVKGYWNNSVRRTPQTRLMADPLGCVRQADQGNLLWCMDLSAWLWRVIDTGCAQDEDQ
jgi:hypothetical protein